MYNSDYIPHDQKVIDDYVKEFEQSRKIILSKVRFDKGFEDSVVALNFLNELMFWGYSKVNIYHVVYNMAYDYLKSALDSMTDDDFYKVLRVVNRWSKAFKCAYDHSSSVNFSWAFSELLKEVRPLIID